MLTEIKIKADKLKEALQEVAVPEHCYTEIVLKDGKITIKTLSEAGEILKTSSEILADANITEWRYLAYNKFLELALYRVWKAEAELIKILQSDKSENVRISAYKTIDNKLDCIISFTIVEN